MEAKPKANRFTPAVYAWAVSNAIRAAATSHSDDVSPPLSGRRQYAVRRAVAVGNAAMTLPACSASHSAGDYAANTWC